MSKQHISRAGSWVVTLGILIGLGFGASQLFAGTRTVCEGYDGTCSSQAACESLCLMLYPENGGEGRCDPNGCCLCAQR